MSLTERMLPAAVILVMLGVGILAWSIRLRPPLVVEAHSLEALPMTLSGWSGEDRAIPDSVTEMLRADFQMQRIYKHPAAGLSWVYVGYYGSARGGRPEHLPHVCYPAQGWKILEKRTVAIDPASGLHANEFIVEQAGERQLVHFWFRTHRATGLLTIWQIHVDHFFGRLTQGRSDGALIRVSTVLFPEDDLEMARARLRGLETTLDEQLTLHWPKEMSQRAPAPAANASR